MARGPRISALAFGTATAAVVVLLWLMVAMVVARSMAMSLVRTMRHEPTPRRE